MRKGEFTFQINLESFTEEVAQAIINKLSLDQTKQADKSEPEEEYLTTAEALKKLKITSATTLRKWEKEGRIQKGVKIGGKGKVYKKSDLENYLNNGC